MDILSGILQSELDSFHKARWIKASLSGSLQLVEKV